MVPIKGSNVTDLKFKNREIILQLLKNSGALPRADIAKYVGLTPASITILVNEMAEEGIVMEIGQLEESDRKLGRKKTLVDINYDYKYVVGINIESDVVNIGVSNIKGETKVCKKMAIDKSLTPEMILKKIASDCMDLLWKENILKKDVLGVGVGIVGKVDEIKGISIHAYGIWKQEVDVKGIIEKELGLSVVIDNNVRAMALGEIDHHTKENKATIFFVKFSPGVGGAMIINNEIYYGSNNAACEIGHTKVIENGELCKCGGYSCLETVASNHAIKKTLSPVFSKEQVPNLYELCKGDSQEITIETACEAAKMGDSLVQEVLNNVIHYLALAISNAVSLYDPGRVILCGKAFKYDFFITELKKKIGESILHDCIDDFITLSELNHKSNYIGGVALALREFFYNKGGAQS